MKYETKNKTAYLPPYFATKDDEFFKDLPMTCTNAASASEYLIKLADEHPNSTIRIGERFKVLDGNGDIVTKTYDITNQCIEIIWNYCTAQNV